MNKLTIKKGYDCRGGRSFSIVRTDTGETVDTGYESYLAAAKAATDKEAELLAPRELIHD